jgi:hypothetical protein
MSRTFALAIVLTIGGGIACGRNSVTVPSPAGPSGAATATSTTTATASAAGLVYVEGVIASIDGTVQSFVVHGTTVNVPSTAVIRDKGATVTFADLTVGERVHVRGTGTVGGSVTASEIVVEGVPPANISVVSGAVTNLAGTCPSLTFTVGGTTVHTSATTRFDPDGCARIANGSTVRVEGVKQTDGSIQAGRVVELEEVPQ